MNQPEVMEYASQAADRLLSHSGDRLDERLEFIFHQVLGRPPTAAEKRVAVDLVAPAGQNGDDRDGWAMLYQVLFQCIDFRYLN